MAARILVIEDNPANLELVVYMLRRAGHAVLTAVDGSEGLRLARLEQPDLTLCDLQLPLLDGYGVLQALRAAPASRDLRVVALTAFSMPGDERKVMAAGFDGYLSKPIEPERFVAMVEAFLPLRLRSRNGAG